MGYRFGEKPWSFQKFCLFLIAVYLLAPSADFVLAVKGRIAFTSNREGERAIYIMDGNGGNPSKVAEGGYPAWSPPALAVSSPGRLVTRWGDVKQSAKLLRTVK